jgi:hypothetical protein
MQLPAMVCRKPAFTAMSLDGEGHPLLLGLENRALPYREGKFEHIEISKDIDAITISFAETRDRKTWIGTRDIGQFRMDQATLDFSCP